MQQTFTVEPNARVNLVNTRGDLEVRGWDKQEIGLEWQEHIDTLNQEGNTLMLAGCTGDLKISAPYDSEILVGHLEGDITAQDIRRIELEDVRGSVQLQNIGIDTDPRDSREAIFLRNIEGDVGVQKASSLHAQRKIGGDVELRDIREVEIEVVRADLEARQVEILALGSVGAGLKAQGIGRTLRCGNIGADCELKESTQAEIDLGNVGADLQIEAAASLRLGNVGADAEIRDVRGEVQIGNVSADATITGVGGQLTIGQVGADAHLLGVNGAVRVGGVGGDLKLQAAFAPETHSYLHVGGEAEVILPEVANLMLQATVGGTISGTGVTFDHHGNFVSLVYGEGAAQLSLNAGGDLRLRGGGTPRVSSAGMPWNEFNQEMAELGQSMARLGREIGLEFKDMFSDMGRTWTDDVSRKVEARMRRAREKAERQARRAAERAREAEELSRRHMREHERRHRDRMYVRVNEREWQMNPERLNDLLDRAQQAAMEGVAGAMEAVERAMSNLRVPHPPRPGWPPAPPRPPAGGPVPPVPPFPPAGGPVPPMSPVPPTGGPIPPASPIGDAQPLDPAAPAPAVPQPVPESPEPATETNLEEERMAILRMIAEGRITPEEGDMLLEGLENR